MRHFLVVTSLFEALTGLVFAASPELAIPLLTGVEINEPATLVVTRLAGFALIALGGACWFARTDSGSPAGRGLLTAMLFYNAAILALLLYAAFGPGLAGILLWPAAVAHGFLGLWCAREVVRPRGA